MITPAMWIGLVVGIIALLYCSADVFVRGRDWPRPRYAPQHRRNRK